MSLSRWKLMAGVLGVSLGGLATAASQCPKTDSTKSAPSDEPVASSPALPPVPVPAPAAQLPLPAPSDTLPPLPTPSSEPVKNPTVAPSGLPVIPASGTTPTPPSPSLPSSPAPEPPKPAPAPPADLLPPAPGGLLPATPPPAASIPAPSRAPAADPLVEPPAPSRVEITKPVAAAPVAATVPAAASKYRIVLRVGEGDPTFEVRCGDDLMLKVVCENVDVKSPEKGKGHGLSAVKASGKVRFAGFGAEGTCEELSFLAGSGTVEMTGKVMIQVKDKLGRIESELTTESMKYKIDPASVGGAIKP